MKKLSLILFALFTATAYSQDAIGVSRSLATSTTLDVTVTSERAIESRAASCE